MLDAALADSDSELHAHLGRGDFRAAGGWLVTRYTREVLGLCGAMVRDREAAEDLAQDVFGNAFRALPTFRADASSRTWLLAIAKNRCIDHLRARKRDAFPASDGPEIEEHPDDSPLPPDLLARRADVEGALADLSEGERALIVLRFRHGLEYEELANVFGLKAGTVRMRVSRALSRVRDHLVAAPGQAPSAFGRAHEEEGEASMDDRAVPPPPAPSSPRSAPAPAPAARPTRPTPPAALGAPSHATPPPAPPPERAKLKGRLGRVLDSFGRRPSAPPSAQAPSGAPQAPQRASHPLTAFFDATEGGVSSSFRDRLMALVSEIDSADP